MDGLEGIMCARSFLLLCLVRDELRLIKEVPS